MERITKIYTEVPSSENEEVKVSITNKVATTFDKVFLKKEDSFTLLDLYKHYKDFLNQKIFTTYSKDNPSEYDSVLVWYDINEENILADEEQENND